ncbi:C25 family cysteine peptidase [Halobacteriovorax marinus]|nr:C25 family cysteine peptidase [Halobacteriovorax marinus]
MTKSMWTTVLLLFALPTLAQVELTQVRKSARTTSLNWNFKKSDLVITESKLERPYSFKEINLENWFNSKSVGEASLPFKSILFEGSPKDFKVELSALKVEVIDNLIPTPAQKMPCRCEVVPWKFSADYNDESYNKSELVHVFKESLGVFKGKEITRISIYPFAYNHAQGTRVVLKGEVSITSKSELKTFSLKASDKNYHIFSKRKYQQSLARLVELRESEGFKVRLHALEDIGHDSALVKEYIHNLYKSEKFSYALIIGHEEEFPTHYTATQFDSRTPTDIFYYTMDGEEDVIPDVLYARLSVSSTEELESVINKTIEFENKSWASKTGSSSMIAIASDEGSAPDDVEYVREMHRPLKEKFSWKSHEFFQGQSSGSADNIVSQLEEGSIWLNYIGHGTGFEWPSVYGREFLVSDLEGVGSEQVKPVVIDVACQNGRYSNEGRMGEMFIRGYGQNSGAVAYYGGSVDISWDPPAIMAIGINKAVSENNMRRLIDVIFEGQTYLLENIDDREAALENLIWYHLQGDPLLNLSNI